MGIGAIFKGGKALKLQKKGQKEEAIRIYEEAFAEGLNDPRYLLPYAGNDTAAAGGADGVLRHVLLPPRECG